jgi:hypothetical protein
MRVERFCSYFLGAALAALSGGAHAAPRPATAAAAAAPPRPVPASEARSPYAKDPVHFEVNKQRAAELFGAAESNWNRSFDADRVKSQLKVLANGEGTLPKGEVEELKLVRKDGNILRGSFVLFGKNHEAPPKLDAFVTKFGKVNDAIAAGDPKETARQADKALKTLDVHGFDKEVRHFKPSSRRAFDDFLASSDNRTLESLDKPTVPAPEFHEMRKSLTKLLSIMTLDPKLREDPAVDDLYKHTFALQTDMGTLHDKLIERSLRGQIDYDHYQVTIPAPMKAELRAILSRLQ